MKQSSAVRTIIASILTLLLLVAVPVAFAQAGGRGGVGGEGGIGGAGRVGGSRGGGVTGGSRSGGPVGGGARGGVIGGGERTHILRTPSSHHRFHAPSSHHHSHHDPSFFFGFGVSTFAPAWSWYDPYYYWGVPPYSPSYPYYGYPYSDYYYGYPYYGSDPCLSPDPAYAPYCPPTADNLYNPGYSVPPVDYPSLAPPIQPESGREPQSPVND